MHFFPRSKVNVVISLLIVSSAFFALLISARTVVRATSTQITLTPNSGSPTTLAKVHGTGFKASEMVSIDFDTTLLATVTTSTSGAIWVTIAVPKSAQPGNHTVLATGQSSGRSASSTFLVQTNWAMIGFNPHHTHFNPYENVLSTTNVSTLQGGKIAYFATYVHSSPVIANGIVYIEAASSIYAYQVCQCWSQLLWSATIGYQADTTPAVTNGIVYASSDNGSLYAFNAATGAPLWNINTGSYNYSSLTVDNNIVYVGTEGSNGGQLYAINANTGATIWNANTANINSSSPAVANGIVYVGAEDHNLYAFNAKTGTPLWTATTGDALYSSPAVANGIVYIGSYDGKLYAFNATTGAPLWNYSTKAPIFYSSPAVANGEVYIGSQDDNLYAFNAKTGAPLWNYTTGGMITSSPTVANGVIYISSWDNHLYAFNAKTGAILWSTSNESQTESSPTVTNGMVFIGTSDDYLCLFNLPGQAPPGYQK